MNAVTLDDLQESVQDLSAFTKLSDYQAICTEFLGLVGKTRPTRIVSPSLPHYIFYQYDSRYENKITRPLNTNLFYESESIFNDAFKRFIEFLALLKKYNGQAIDREEIREILKPNEVNKVVYSMQQSIGCISDSFESPNQSRKRVGTLFEDLIKLIMRQIGLICEQRTIYLPVSPDSDQLLSYQLDLVFSRGNAIIASETSFIHPREVVASVKTTSKDRIDKIFLDKYMLTKLIGRDIPVIAIFLHDVQRARRGNSIFGVNSTFKTNHFLGYTIALNKLNGVYYIDPRPEMVSNELLRKQISDFQNFLVKDLWELSI